MAFCKEPEFYIGLMSGTSLDGVDGVVASFDQGETANARDVNLVRIRVHAHVHIHFDERLVAEFTALNQATDNELHRAALAANSLARVYAQVVENLLSQSGLKSRQIQAIATHGQTVRHQPHQFDGLGYTVQLNNPALLAELCGIDVVTDFRNRDLAAGGQGAPLVPAFHRAVFKHARAPFAIVNLGGISNLSLFDTHGECRGFDCGPANTLMDYWCLTHRGQAFDLNGQWAATGQVIEPLMQAFLDEPYLELPPPKSTGRDLFNPSWLQSKLEQAALSLKTACPWAAHDVQATLAEFTVQAVVHSLRQHLPQVKTLYACGGGAFNTHLIKRFEESLPEVAVHTTEMLGLPPDQVEAAAFAWLAWAYIHRVPGNLPEVTGAKGPRILGALYPA